MQLKTTFLNLYSKFTSQFQDYDFMTEGQILIKDFVFIIRTWTCLQTLKYITLLRANE